MIRSPLHVEHADLFDGVRLAAQPPPTNAASACVSWVAPAGSGHDPRGREGTAFLTAQVATAAAGHYDRRALARALDGLGATLTHHLAPESVEFTVWGPADEWRQLLALLSYVVLHPRFAEEDVARAHRQLAERQMREAEQPSHRAERELLHAIFPVGHPYRETGLGSRRSTGRLGRMALREFHRSHYRARGGLLVVTAPAPPEVVRREGRRRFGDLRGAPDPPALLFPEVVERKAVHQIDLPQRSQVEFRIGGLSLPRSAPEYPALSLAEEILGGRPLLCRLFQRVREEEGLAYHASSQLEAMRYGGYWTVQAGTSPAHALPALRLLRHELHRLTSEPVASEELDRIRESAIGELTLSTESTIEVHELAVDLAYHALPGDFWERWPETLRSVTPEQVQRAAEKGLSSRRAVTVIAGPRGSSR